jgi:hypothetical protein
MLRCILKTSKNVIKKYFQIVLLVSRLQEVKNPYTYFSLIILIPNFYDMYIMYSKEHFIKN